MCFLDFELSRVLPRVYDLAYASTAILSSTFPSLDEAGRNAFFDTAHAIWEGYHQHSPLSPEEQHALPDMVVAIQLICVAAFAGTQKYASLAQINQHMLSFILNNIHKL